MNIKIGIRREDINKWEKRVPLIPSHARELADRYPMEFRVQPSAIRIFNDADYCLSGIPVEESLSPCPIVLALKEIPVELIEKGKTYLFFSHTAKGQSQNMPMLRRMMELGCTVIDYEKMVDEKGRRVLYFGNYAGHAGMIDTLWTLGRRLETEGIANPFSMLRPRTHYSSLVEAREAVGKLAAKIVKDGLPDALDPVVFGFFGYGHVSQGAQEMFDLLPVETVPPADVPALFARGAKVRPAPLQDRASTRRTWSGPSIRPRRFDLQDYYDHPEGYRPVTEDLVPYLTAVVNGIYWTPEIPEVHHQAFPEEALRAAAPSPGSASSATSPATSTAPSNARSCPRTRRIRCTSTIRSRTKPCRASPAGARPSWPSTICRPSCLSNRRPTSAAS